jgi:hypothetical protein
MSSTSGTTPFHLGHLTNPQECDEQGLERLLDRAGSLHAAWHQCGFADWLLALLRRHAADRLAKGEWDIALRRFACWCVTDADRGSLWLEVQTAERFIAGRCAADELTKQQTRSRGAATGAGVCGLPKAIPAAAVQIAAWHTCDLNAFDAAWWTSHFAARAAVFRRAREKSKNWRSPSDRGEPWREHYRAAEWIDATFKVKHDIERQTRRRQAAVLKLHIEDPFAEA